MIYEATTDRTRALGAAAAAFAAVRPRERSPRPAALPRRRRAGFTLIEMLVVISIIVLLMAIALPSISAMFTSGADAQARNVISSQLATARSIAIRDRRPTGVHFQRHLQASALPARSFRNDDGYWLAIVQLKNVVIDNNGNRDYRWCLADGMVPEKIPGGLVAGEVSNTLVNSLQTPPPLPRFDLANFDNLMIDFACFTVVFGPDGKLMDMQADDMRFCSQVEQTQGSSADQEQKGWLFADPAAAADSRDSSAIWWEMPNPIDPADNNDPNKEASVRSISLIDPVVLQALPDELSRRQWLLDNAQWLAVNPYSGGLIRNRRE